MTETSFHCTEKYVLTEYMFVIKVEIEMEWEGCCSRTASERLDYKISQTCHLKIMTIITIQLSDT